MTATQRGGHVQFSIVNGTGTPFSVKDTQICPLPSCGTRPPAVPSTAPFLSCCPASASMHSSPRYELSRPFSCRITTHPSRQETTIPSSMARTLSPSAAAKSTAWCACHEAGLPGKAAGFDQKRPDGPSSRLPSAPASRPPTAGSPPRTAAPANNAPRIPGRGENVSAYRFFIGRFAPAWYCPPSGSASREWDWGRFRRGSRGPACGWRGR